MISTWEIIKETRFTIFKKSHSYLRFFECVHLVWKTIWFSVWLDLKVSRMVKHNFRYTCDDISRKTYLTSENKTWSVAQSNNLEGLNETNFKKEKVIWLLWHLFALSPAWFKIWTSSIPHHLHRHHHHVLSATIDWHP